MGYQIFSTKYFLYEVFSVRKMDILTLFYYVSGVDYELLGVGHDAHQGVVHDGEQDVLAGQCLLGDAGLLLDYWYAQNSRRFEWLTLRSLDLIGQIQQRLNRISLLKHCSLSLRVLFSIIIALHELRHPALPVEVEIFCQDFADLILVFPGSRENQASIPEPHHFHPKHVLHMALFVDLDVVVADILFILDHFVVILDHLELPHYDAIIFV